jgi:hypothetical protein
METSILERATAVVSTHEHAARVAKASDRSNLARGFHAHVIDIPHGSNIDAVPNAPVEDNLVLASRHASGTDDTPAAHDSPAPIHNCEPAHAFFFIIISVGCYADFPFLVWCIGACQPLRCWLLRHATLSSFELLEWINCCGI